MYIRTQALLQSIPVQYVLATSQVGELATSAPNAMDGHAKCSGIINAAQYRRKGDWTCDACLVPQSQQSPPPTRSPAPPTKQISDDSTFNVLQLNANGIGNKLTELEVVLERNTIKVAVIQESKLSHKSKNPCIQNYNTVCRIDPMVNEENC